MVRQLKESDDVAGIANVIASPGARCFLNLDDEVMILRLLAQTSPKVHDPLTTKALVDSAVDKKVCSFFSTHEKKGS